MILIGGGSRSGKTAYALERASGFGARLAYVATAEALDEEMRARAAAHRAERGRAFTTFEEPLALAELIERRGTGFDAMVIDCLTVWLSNVMLSETHDAGSETRRLLEAAAAGGRTLVLVTNEVGAGIVPGNELARRFRDQAGWLNQQMATVADEVYWMAFGCPLRVK